MARKTKTETAVDPVEPVEATLPESVLLALADLIYATYGNSGTAVLTEPVPVVEEPEPEEEPEVEEEDVEEADADDEVDIDVERETLMKLSIAEIRKRLVAREFDEDDVKGEKSKAVLVDSLLDDMYGEDDDEEEPEDADEVDEDDEPEDIEDDADDEDSDDEDDEDSDDEDEEESDEEDEPYTEEELTDMSLGELKEIAADWEIEVSKGARAKTYVKAILEAQEMEEDSEADGEEDEYEEEDRAELEALTLAELRKKAREEYGLTSRDVKNADKDAILDLIFEDED